METAEGDVPKWKVPTSFPHITNWKPESAGRRRRGSILRTMSKRSEERVAIFGLSKSGKTALALQLSYVDPIIMSTTPLTPPAGTCITYNPDESMMMMLWDMNGKETARRETWPAQCAPASAIMFVFNCADTSTFELAKEELYTLLSHPDLGPTVPLLVWANKMDVVGSIDESALASMLALESREDCARRQWCVQGSVMHDRAHGLDHGTKWLYQALSQKDNKKWTPLPAERVPNENLLEVIAACTYEEAHPPPTASPRAAAPDFASASPTKAGLRNSLATIVHDDDEESIDDEERGCSAVPVLPISLEGLEVNTLQSSATCSAENAHMNIWSAPYCTNYEPLAASPKGKIPKMKVRDLRAIICGIEGAGKTTVAIQSEKKTEITWAPGLTPITGSMTHQKHQKNNLILWDMNGSAEGQKIWATHLEGQDFGGVIYVVDATKREDVTAAIEGFDMLMSAKALKSNTPVVVLSNKQDVAVEDKMDAYELAQSFNLDKLSRRWRVQECSARLGTGVDQALDWLYLAEGAKPLKNEESFLQDAASAVLQRAAMSPVERLVISESESGASTPKKKRRVRVLKKSTMREGVDLSSKKKADIKEGSVLDVLGEKVGENGKVRLKVRIPKTAFSQSVTGWASVQGKDGDLLLKELGKAASGTPTPTSPLKSATVAAAAQASADDAVEAEAEKDQAKVAPSAAEVAAGHQAATVAAEREAETDAETRAAVADVKTEHVAGPIAAIEAKAAPIEAEAESAEAAAGPVAATEAKAMPTEADAESAEAVAEPVTEAVTADTETVHSVLEAEAEADQAKAAPLSAADAGEAAAEPEAATADAESVHSALEAEAEPDQAKAPIEAAADAGEAAAAAEATTDDAETEAEAEAEGEAAPAAAAEAKAAPATGAEPQNAGTPPDEDA